MTTVQTVFYVINTTGGAFDLYSTVLQFVYIPTQNTYNSFICAIYFSRLIVQLIAGLIVIGISAY